MKRYLGLGPLILALIGAAMTGCGERVATSDTQAPRYTQETVPVEKMTGMTSTHGGSRQDFRTEYLAADKQFAAEVHAAAAMDRGRIWANWFADDGRQFIPGRIVQGPEAIADLMAGAFNTPGYSLQWAPDQVVVAAA